MFIAYSCRTQLPSGTRRKSHAAVASSLATSLLPREYMWMPIWLKPPSGLRIQMRCASGCSRSRCRLYSRKVRCG